MRSVRCDSCGTKALMAASKCPKCAHGLEVRDGFGELLPLSHCSTCDSYYPVTAGACKWCGTQPARAPIGPNIWKGAGVVAFVAMAWGAWLVHDDPPAEVSAARMESILKPDSSAATDSVISAGSLASASVAADSSTAPDTTPVVAVLTDSLSQPDSTIVASVDTTITPVDSAPTVVVVADSAPGEPEPPPVIEPTPVALPPAPTPAPRVRVPARSVERAPVRAPARTLARAPAPTRSRAATKPPKVASASKPAARSTAKPGAKPGAKSVAKAPAKSRTRSVWVSTVARNWVVVRADARRTARVIASIGPNTRVQLGESRGGWRRIRAKGLAGWVEHRSFFATVGAGRSVGRLAVR